MKLIQRVKRQMGNEGGNAKGGGPAPPGGAGGESSTPTRVKNLKSAAPKSGGGSTRKGDDNPFSLLPSLRETPVSERPEVLKKKLHACSINFDFNSQTCMAEKEAKRQALLELVEYVNNTRHCFNDSVIQDVIEMVSSNVIRALPPSHRTASVGEDEEEPALEQAWPHLQIVYEFFLRFVVSHDVDPKIAKKYIDQTFVLKLLDLFDSEDPRERDYLKTILHRIYGKIMALRLFIRKATQNLFFKIIYDNDQHSGVPELLEILGSIINGFALPLKEEHKSFLERSLIPLHKVKYLNAFHQQLSYCITQYVEKDPQLSSTIVECLLRIWPCTCSSKEVLFLNEIEEILELMQPAEFQKLQVQLFKRVALCIRSPHFQVAERALFIWNNDDIVKLVNQSRQVLFPIVVGSLYQNSKQHWNGTVHGLTYNVLRLLMEADPALFDDCSAQHRVAEDRELEEQRHRELTWTEMIAAYEKNASEKIKTAWNPPEHIRRRS